MLNGRDRTERAERPVSERDEANRDPSRLPVNNLEAYKTWCQQVRDDWEDEGQ